MNLLIHSKILCGCTLSNIRKNANSMIVAENVKYEYNLYLIVFTLIYLLYQFQ